MAQEEVAIQSQRLPFSAHASSYLLARLILAAVFIYAGSTKIVEPRAFATVISGYGLVSEGAASLLAVAIPLLEIIAGLGLVFDVKGSLAVLTGLTLLFMAVLWHGIRLGLDIDCGCYAPGDPEGEAFHGLKEALLRDAGLLALSAWCYWQRRRLKPQLKTWRFVTRRTTNDQGGD